MSISITFYQNSAETNRVNKTSYMTFVSTLTGEFKDEIDIMSPTILIETSDIPNYNYCYISTLGRYYFIDNYTIVRTGLIELELSVDLLMSYKDKILQQTAFINTQQNNYNDYIVDTNRAYEQGYNIDEITLTNTLFTGSTYATGTDSDYCFLLTGVGVEQSSVYINYSVVVKANTECIINGRIITQSSNDRTLTYENPSFSIKISYGAEQVYVYKVINNVNILVATIQPLNEYTTEVNNGDRFIVSSQQL